MSTVVDGVCQGIISNPDISGPGVRIALYLQSLLSVLLVRFSPKDAPGAYWSMTSTSFSLIISCIVTSATKQTSLLDAIVVVYVLLLPVLASAFGLSEIISLQNKKNETRSIASPLLIVANWTRSAFTYSFALYVWISAPTLGSGPPECNAHTKFIFFGASLPALGSGRWLNLAIWSVLTFLFVWRSLKGRKTIYICLTALTSKTASQALLKPKTSQDEVHREDVVRKNFATGEVIHTTRTFRPRQIFHEMLQGMASQILSWAPSGTGRWYRFYGKTVLITVLAIWAIIMTELELSLNDQSSLNSQWGFGQILPLLLTISPLFSLWESFLSRNSSGPTSKPRKIRFTMRKATNLHRPRSELDYLTPEQIAELPEDVVKVHRAPSAFAVITIDDREMYTTYEERDSNDPEWKESFDIEVDDMSTIVIRVFDSKCIDHGWRSFIGFTTVHPFTVFPHPRDPASWQRPGDFPREDGEADGEGEGDEETDGAVLHKDPSTLDIDDIPLVRDGQTMPDMTVSITISTDTREPPRPPHVPPVLGLKVERMERRVNLVKFGNKKWGSKKVTTTNVYEMR